jgi:DNA-binding NtrC family response regulator
MVAEVVLAILELGAYRVTYFADPLQAVEAFKCADPKPDLILTDFVMPGMNGMELIQHCKAVRPEQKTVLYSGNVWEDDILSYPIQPHRFLRKPFPPQVLLDLVASVLQG